MTSSELLHNKTLTHYATFGSSHNRPATGNPTINATDDLVPAPRQDPEPAPFGEGTDITSSPHTRDTEGGQAHGLKAGEEEKEAIVGAEGYYKGWYRWAVVAAVSVLSITNAMQWIAFSPVQDLAMDYWDVSAMAISSLSTIFMVVYIPLWPVSAWALDIKGLRFGLILSAVLNFVGATLKLPGCIESLPGSNRFWFVLIGQAISGISQTFFMGSPPKVAANWFQVQERTLATAIISLVNPFGIALGTYLSPAIVNSGDDFLTLLGVHSAVMAVALVLIIVVIRDKPPKPPSPTVTKSSVMSGREYLTNIKRLFLDPQFDITILSCTLTLGAFWGSLSILSSLLTPLGYTDSQMGNLCSMATVMGVLGGALLAVLVDRLRAYKVLTVINLLGLDVGYVALYFAAIPDNLFWQILCWGWIGFFGSSVIPAFLELGVESTYPIPEGISANVQLASAQISGIAIIYIGTFYGGTENGPLTVSCMLTSSVTLALVLMLICRPHYRRLEIERGGKENLVQNEK